jgi:hypothetical protein
MERSMMTGMKIFVALCTFVGTLAAQDLTGRWVATENLAK